MNSRDIALPYKPTQMVISFQLSQSGVRIYYKDDSTEEFDFKQLENFSYQGAPSRADIVQALAILSESVTVKGIWQSESQVMRFKVLFFLLLCLLS